MEEVRTFTVAESDSQTRLDVYLADALAPLSRSQVKTLIEKGLVLVDGSTTKAGLKLRGGDRVEVRIPPPPPVGVEAEAIPLDILYEDSDIIVINKPPGLAVHPGAGRRTGTLVSALLHHTRDLSTVGGPERPGIVHRLDKDTTGSLVIARNDDAHRALAAQFKAHTTTRRYRALVWGSPAEDEGVIDLSLGRSRTDRKKISTRTRSKKRRAVTRFHVVRRYGLLSLVDLFPETGRTHQLRVHLAAVGHPIAGDPVYCKRKVPPALAKGAADELKKIKRQLLHAATLGFTHPATGETVEFTAPVPEDMQRVIDALEESCSENDRE